MAGRLSTGGVRKLSELTLREFQTFKLSTLVRFINKTWIIGKIHLVFLQQSAQFTFDQHILSSGTCRREETRLWFWDMNQIKDE